MEQIEIIRTSLTKDSPQFGVMYVKGTIPRFLTLELPNLDNHHDISCIPLGRYICKRRASVITEGEDTFEVMNVPNRSSILFHWGNTIKDTKGCILLGLSLGEIGFNPAILNSKKAWRKFMAYLHHIDEFELFIKGIS